GEARVRENDPRPLRGRDHRPLRGLPSLRGGGGRKRSRSAGLGRVSSGRSRVRSTGVPSMRVQGTLIEDTYAEAFTMRAARLIITADSERWALTAARTMTGFATSVIGCDCEAGPEGPAPARTPDGRPGVRVLVFARSSEILQEQLTRRVGQCVMTAATTACFD